MHSSSVLFSCSLAFSLVACGFQADDPLDEEVPSPSLDRVFAETPIPLAGFGSSVALVDDLLVVGLAGDDTDGVDAGSVHVFVREDDEWVFTVRLIPDDLRPDDHFGAAVAVMGTAPDHVMVIGAPGNDFEQRNAGAIYDYRQIGVNWRQNGKILPRGGEAEDAFGGSLAISGEGVDAVLAVGASGEDAGGRDAGSVHLFEFTIATWLPLR